MKTDGYKTSRSEKVSIYPFDELPDSHFIDVTIEQNWSGEGSGYEPAKINWSALGAVEIHDAERFAQALVRAAEIGKELNQKYGVLCPTIQK